MKIMEKFIFVIVLKTTKKLIKSSLMMDNIKIKMIGEKNNEEVIKTKEHIEDHFLKRSQNKKRKNNLL